MRYPNSYCVFDFETTGLDPLNDRVLEIGVLKIVDGQETARYSKLVNWGIDVPAIISQLTGITTEEVQRDGIHPEQARQEFKELIFGETLVGHNIYSFDLKFLRAFLQINQEQWQELNYRFVDTAAQVKAHKMGEDRHWYENYSEFVDRIMSTKRFGVKFNLGLCCEEYGIAASNQHRAIGDVLLTHELYKKICLT